MKNLRPDLNGVLVIDKPLRWTSADVCRFIRRGVGGAKVGHAGTLDPLATGVLVVCLGRATKQIPTLMDGEKRYAAVIDLSNLSSTDDLEGELTSVPLPDAGPPAADRVAGVCAAFVGPIMQSPPAHSAIWINGERAYDKARRGETLRMTPRPIIIHSITLLAYAWPILELDIRCAKGAYIRSLARDIGASLGVGGMLTALRRTRVGPHTLDSALTPEAAVVHAEGHLKPAPLPLTDLPISSTFNPCSSPSA